MAACEEVMMKIIMGAELTAARWRAGTHLLHPAKGTKVKRPGRKEG